MNNWFDVDKAGLAKLMAGRSKASTPKHPAGVHTARSKAS